MVTNIDMFVQMNKFAEGLVGQDRVEYGIALEAAAKAMRNVNNGKVSLGQLRALECTAEFCRMCLEDKQRKEKKTRENPTNLPKPS